MNALFKLGWVSGSGGRPHPTFLWQACSYFRRCKYENNFTDRWTDNTQSEELAFSSVEPKIVGMKKDNSFSTFKTLFLLSHVNKYQTRNHKISSEMSCTFNEINSTCESYSADIFKQGIIRHLLATPRKYNAHSMK